MKVFFPFQIILFILPLTAFAETESKEKLISILDEAPEVYFGVKRFSKFYGDHNSQGKEEDESILERRYLLGSSNGVRDALAENGLVVDAGVTQVYQGTASGDGKGGEFAGSGDLWVAFDTARAGLWSGGLFYSHFEGNWGKVVSGTGALLPLNGDTIMPGEPEKIALSEFLFFQALPENFAILGGKVNWSAFADKSFFANDERSQFLHEGLINNAVLGSFVPYTSLGGGLVKQFGKEGSIALVMTSSDSKATSTGFETLSADAMTYGTAAAWTPTFSGLPGSYNMLVGYNTRSSVNFNVDQEYFLEEVTGQAPISTKEDNYAITLGLSQYFWVDENAKRLDGKPVGIGPFARFGIAPTDRNLIDQFYSLGLGGYGGPFDRTEDNWGIGWAGTHFSGDLREDLSSVGIDTDNFEHAGESFYNVAITPAMRVSFHVQVVDSAIPGRDNSVVMGSRLQVDL